MTINSITIISKLTRFYNDNVQKCIHIGSLNFYLRKKGYTANLHAIIKYKYILYFFIFYIYTFIYYMIPELYFPKHV